MEDTLNLNLSTAIIGLATFWLMAKLLRISKNSPPGPWGVPVFGCLPYFFFTRKRFRDVFKDWYYKYGPIYSLKIGSASFVILNDYDSIHDALIKPEFQNRIKPDVVSYSSGEGIAFSNGRVWREQRKFAHQIFRDLGVGKASFEDVIVREASFLADALLKFDGNSINITHLTNNAVSNVVSSIAFGKRFEYNDRKLANVLGKLSDNTQKSHFQRALSVFLPFTKYLPFGGNKKMRENVNIYIQFQNEITSEHRNALDEENVKDLTDAYILEINKSGNRGMMDVFNDDNMVWTIADLHLAGTETTSTTLLWIFLFLLNNPDIETKVRRQLDEVVGRNRLPRYSDRPNLPLVEAIISESLRLGTVCTLSLPHVAATDSELQGFNIPKGTIVVPNFYALFTNKEKWDDPEKFRPERFLDKNGNFVKREDFIPFSTGRRLCIGEQLARMELFVFFTHILQKMSFSVPPGCETPTTEGIDGISHKPKEYEVLIRKCVE